MNPAPQFRGPLNGCAAESVITTNAGRFVFSVPKPYVVHAPSEGRPARIEPVFIWHTPPEWLIPSAMHERITAISSTICAVCGNQSDTHSPLCPCRFHCRFEANNGDPDSPIAVITLPKLGGNGLPARSASRGLGSNKSI